MNWDFFGQRNLSIEDLIAQLNPIDLQRVRNPFFLIDFLFHLNAIYKVSGDKALVSNFIKKYQTFFETYQYSEELYVLLRKLSISSGFKFNQLLRESYRDKFHKPINIENSQRAEALSSKGYIALTPTDDSKVLAKKILKYFQNLPVVREVDGKVDMLENFKNHDIKNGGFRYFYQEQDLPITDALTFLEQSGIYNIIEGYIGSPILRNVNAWHSVALDNFTDTEESIAAQKYHFDMDIPSGWIKVFLYLTDVTDIDTGPHIYVPKSHKLLNSKLVFVKLQFINSEPKD